MIRLITYAFVALFISLFVSTSDANAHANHNHGVDKSIIDQKTKDIQKTEYGGLDVERITGYMDCPFSCCNIACAACCVFINTNDQISITNLNASIQKFLQKQQQLHRQITYSDSPPPRS